VSVYDPRRPWNRDRRGHLRRAHRIDDPHRWRQVEDAIPLALLGEGSSTRRSGWSATWATTPIVLPITQRSHDSIVAVSVPKQRSSPSRMSNPFLIFDEMAIFAVQ